MRLTYAPTYGTAVADGGIEQWWTVTVDSPHVGSLRTVGQITMLTRALLAQVRGEIDELTITYLGVTVPVVNGQFPEGLPPGMDEWTGLELGWVREMNGIRGAQESAEDGSGSAEPG